MKTANPKSKPNSRQQPPFVRERKERQQAMGACKFKLGIVQDHCNEKRKMGSGRGNRNGNRKAVPLYGKDYGQRFDELVRICQSISNKQIILLAQPPHNASQPQPQQQQQQQQQKQNNSKNSNQIHSINLLCTDETVESLMLTNHKARDIFLQRERSLGCERERGAKSSRSFRLDLPEIMERECQGEEEENEGRDTDRGRGRKVCLTDRVSRSAVNVSLGSIKRQGREQGSGDRSNRMLASYTHTQPHKWTSSNLKQSQNTLSTEITPFAFDTHNLNSQAHWEPSKGSISIDVRKLLLSRNKNKGKSKDRERRVQTGTRNYHSSLNYYH